MSIKRLIKKSILEAKAYKPPINRKDYIRLDLNENYAVLNDNILRKLKDFDKFTISSYPEYQELIPLVAKYAGVSNDFISLVNGSDHAIQLLIDLFFEKGDAVVIPSPIFFVYHHFLNIKQALIKNILYIEENGKYKFPFEETLKSLNSNVNPVRSAHGALNPVCANSFLSIHPRGKTAEYSASNGVKGLILCNPNNPLGISIPEHELKELLRKTNELDIPIIVDEAYFEYSKVNATKYLPEYENLIILRTLSKAFGLSGLRLGYVIARPEIISELEKLRLVWSVNHFAVHAGITVLSEINYFKEKIQEQNKIKEMLYDLLCFKGIQCYKTDTNFLVCKHPNYLDVISRLNKNKILVNDVSHYPYSGNILKNAFRINVPSEEDFNLLKNLDF